MVLFKKILNFFGLAVFSIAELEGRREKLFEELKKSEDCARSHSFRVEKHNKNHPEEKMSKDPYVLSEPVQIGGEISMLSRLINDSTPINRIGLQTLDPDNPPNIKHYRPF